MTQKPASAPPCQHRWVSYPHETPPLWMCSKCQDQRETKPVEPAPVAGTLGPCTCGDYYANEPCARHPWPMERPTPQAAPVAQGWDVEDLLDAPKQPQAPAAEPWRADGSLVYLTDNHTIQAMYPAVAAALVSAHNQEIATLRAEVASRTAERDEARKDAAYHSDCRPNRVQAEKAFALAKATNDQLADEIAAHRATREQLEAARTALAESEKRYNALLLRWSTLHDSVLASRAAQPAPDATTAKEKTP